MCRIDCPLIRSIIIGFILTEVQRSVTGQVSRDTHLSVRACCCGCWRPGAARTALARAVLSNLLSEQRGLARSVWLLCVLSTIPARPEGRQPEGPSAALGCTALMQDYANVAACQARLVKAGEWLRLRVAQCFGKSYAASLDAMWSVAE